MIPLPEADSLRQRLALARDRLVKQDVLIAAGHFVIGLPAAAAVAIFSPLPEELKTPLVMGIAIVEGSSAIGEEAGGGVILPFHDSTTQRPRQYF